MRIRISLMLTIILCVPLLAWGDEITVERNRSSNDFIISGRMLHYFQKALTYHREAMQSQSLYNKIQADGIGAVLQQRRGTGDGAAFKVYLLSERRVDFDLPEEVSRADWTLLIKALENAQTQ